MTSLGEALATPGNGEERSFNCPVHGDNHPSASVNIITGLWICYTCGATGKAGEDYVVEPQTLLAFLKKRKIKYETHYFPESWLNLYDSQPHPYWLARFSEQACHAFRLGFDPETECITYPLRDSSGLLLGVVRRHLNWNSKADGPKYVYPRHIDVTKLMFNFTYEARAKALLVEGAADAIACWDAGYTAFAIYGSRFTSHQAQLLRRIGVHHVYTAFDNDEAGRKAHRGAVEMVKDMIVTQIPLGAYKDIAEIPLEERVKLLASWVGEPDHERVVSTTCESTSQDPPKSAQMHFGSTPGPAMLRIKRTKP